jgi:hypothetical protein
MHLGCFLCVVLCVYVVTMGHMCMMTCLLMIPFLVGLCRLHMMLSGSFMMVSGLLVMLGSLVHCHGFSSKLLGSRECEATTLTFGDYSRSKLRLPSD